MTSLAHSKPRRYLGELRVGAVYQSCIRPRITRRVARVAHDNVYYVYMETGKCPRECVATEDTFREFTSHEVKP
jgi:hypothetical protein